MDRCSDARGGGVRRRRLDGPRKRSGIISWSPSRTSLTSKVGRGMQASDKEVVYLASVSWNGLPAVAARIAQAVEAT